ncbi:MAG: AraC-type DNA-binding protein [Nocardioides sp.]|jgi:hypothetical protein|nr:AraC-type DNA-binding protein [Nocardioides sp.]
MTVSRPRRVDSRTSSKHAGRSEAFGRVGSHTPERTTDAGEDEDIVSRQYLPNRHLPRSASREMDLAGLQIGVITCGHPRTVVASDK